MSGEYALVKMDLGELAKPATLLIEKIGDAIGGIFRPYQIRRVAEAEAQAEKIKAASEIEITELQRRALRRFLREEAKKQDNIESITRKALPGVEATARPNEVENDWIVNFFDKCRLISDEEMQILWSQLLAGEANAPGRYSKRTVNLLASLDKTDAELFKSLCSFCWQIGDIVPLIYDVHEGIYTDAAIYFNTLLHLDEIGLISFEPLTGYKRSRFLQKIVVQYYGSFATVEFQQAENNDMSIGNVLLSKAGQELAPICGSGPHPGFKDYVMNKWRSLGYTVSEVASTA